MRPRFLSLVAALSIPTGALCDDRAATVQALIPWLLDETNSLKGVRFADVIAATSGKRIIPLDKSDADDQRILAQVGVAMDEVLASLNAPDSKVRAVRRVNEMSSHF